MVTKDIKHLFTEKGDVLEAIVVYGAKTMKEIQSVFDQTIKTHWTDLHILLGELIQEGDVYMNEKGEYSARPELELDYNYFGEHMDEWFEPPESWEYPDDYVEPEPKYPDIVSTTKSWLKIEKPQVNLHREHFYLEGHYLDTFTKFIITKAFNTIIVVNPFMDRSTPTQLLVKARKTGKTVVVVTRFPKSSYSKKIHEWLEKFGIKLLYYENIHAKILIVDNCLAVVSSMNFKQNATAGITWEAGMVSYAKDLVDEIKASIADLNLENGL